MMPGVSLCMITKDEQNFLERCISSVKPAVDEIIVVDTGSSDNTKEIAEGLGAKVFGFKWCDDFSAARNFSISRAANEWILYLDADETISEADILKIRELTKDSKVDGFAFNIRNYFKGSIKTQKALSDGYAESRGYAGWHEAEIIRLFRNRKEICFTNIIHETVADSIREFKGGVKPAGIVIHHYGLAEEEKSREKTNKYIKMEEKQIQQTPDSPKPYYELGAIYLAQGSFQQAVELFEKARELLEKEKGVHLIHKYLYHDLGKTYFKLGNLEKAKQMLEKAQGIYADNYSTQFFLGLIYDEKKDYLNAVAHYLNSLCLNQQNPSAYRNLGIIYTKQKDYKKAHEMLQREYELEPNDVLAQTLKSLQKKINKIE